jgi:hypothetical protein
MRVIFFGALIDFRAFVGYIIVVREGISKALLLTDATSANGEETLERKRRLYLSGIYFVNNFLKKIA